MSELMHFRPCHYFLIKKNFFLSRHKIYATYFRTVIWVFSKWVCHWYNQINVFERMCAMSTRIYALKKHNVIKLNIIFFAFQKKYLKLFSTMNFLTWKVDLGAFFSRMKRVKKMHKSTFPLIISVYCSSFSTYSRKI